MAAAACTNELKLVARTREYPARFGCRELARTA